MSSDATCADKGVGPDSEGRTLTVLTVVDQAADAELVREALAGQDYALVEAASTDEALLVLLRHPVDIVLIDLQMPGTSGLEMAALIRQRERNRLTPIVLLLDTGLAPATLRQAGMLGMIDFLERPLDPHVVGLAVAHLAEAALPGRVSGESRFVSLLRQVQTENQMTMSVLAAERRYRKLAETVPMIVWTAAPDGTVAYLNHHWIDYTGVHPSQVRSGFTDLVHPDDVARLREVWNRHLAMGREFQTNCRLRRQDGEYRWHLLRMVPEWGATGEISAWYGVLTDIDEIRQHQTALAAFKGTLDMVVDAVWLFDADGDHILYANQGAVSLLGFTWNEYQRMRPADLSGHGGFPGDAASRPLARTLETTLRRKDGTDVPVELSIQFAEDPDGRTIAIARDITDRKRAEAERERLYQDAVHALRLRDEFLSLASHELRTPLTPLRLHLDRIERRLERLAGEEGCPDDVLVGIRTAIRQTDRLTKLVADLLDVSRIMGGRLALRLEQVELVAVLRDLITQFQSEIDRSGSALTLDAPENVVGRWDPARLEQIIANLLSNAIKYGGGQPITVTVAQAGQEATVTVADHGPGIAPEDQERIFLKFERASSPSKTTGLGLGLYIARQIAEGLGGHLTVSSPPGSGASFVLRLPLAGPAVAAHPDGLDNGNGEAA
jgi:PAS domain S-box-containing protein